MYYKLYIDKRKRLNSFVFNSISEAYHYYLRHYSTLGDWFYYWKTAHDFLHKVTDEKCMLAIVHNVFKNVCIVEYKTTEMKER